MQTRQRRAGIVVTEMQEGHPAKTAGLAVGDSLLTCDGKPVLTRAGLSARLFNRMLDRSHPSPEVVLTVASPTGSDASSRTVRLPPASLVQGISFGLDIPPPVRARIPAETMSYTEALARWTEAAEWAIGDKDPLLAAYFQDRAAGIAARQKDRQEVEKRLSLALKRMGEAGPENDPEYRANLWFRLGENAELLWQYERAIACYREAEKLNRETDNVAWLLDTLNRLGLVLLDVGELEAAQKTLEETLTRDAKLRPESLAMARSTNNVAAVLRTRGDLSGALRLYERSLEIRRKLFPDSTRVSLTLNNMGLVARQRGDLSAARLYLAEAMEIDRKAAPGSADYAQTLLNYALVLEDSGDLDGAKRALDECLGLLEKNPLDAATSVSALASYGTNAFKRGDFATAEAFAKRAFDLRAERLPNSPGRATDYLRLGDLAKVRSDWKTAETHYRSGLAIHDRLAPRSLDTVRSLRSLGELLLRTRRAAESLPYLERAVRIIEEQRGELRSNESRALLTERHAETFALLREAYFTVGNLSAAFQTIERARAAAFVEWLAERRLTFPVNPKVAPSMERQRGLDAKRRATYQRLAQLEQAEKGSPAEQAERDALKAKLRAEIDNLDAQQRQLTERIRRDTPEYAQIAYPGPPTLEQARLRLPAGTLVLLYAVGENETTLLTLSPSRPPRRYRLPVTAKVLRQRVAGIRQELARKGSAFGPEARALYDLLVRPAQAEVRAARQLLICPEGPLHTLPFAALMVTGEPLPPLPGKATGSRAPFLAELKPLSYVASLSVLAELRREKAVSRTGTLLALGDPAYGERVEAGGAIGTIRARRKPLPATRHEVQRLGRLFGGKARVLLGKEATREQFRKASSTEQYLHLACHGLLDDADPLGSALALSPAGVEDDGLLRAYEVLNDLRLSADLVTLSACDMALGHETRNEGIVGMTRAFQYAGAKAVLVSLWEILDASTAALMPVFYRALRDGSPANEALRTAQLALLTGTAYRHPFYWAAFSLHGRV